MSEQAKTETTTPATPTRYVARLVNPDTGASVVEYNGKRTASYSNLEAAQEQANERNFCEIDLPARRAARAREV